MEGATPPAAWILSRLCEEFHCLPGALEDEDVMQLLEIIDLRQYAQAKHLIEREDTDEDAIRKQGIPDSMISEVMANKEKAIGKRIG